MTTLHLFLWSLWIPYSKLQFSIRLQVISSTHKKHFFHFLFVYILNIYIWIYQYMNLHIMIHNFMISIWYLSLIYMILYIDIPAWDIFQTRLEFPWSFWWPAVPGWAILTTLGTVVWTLQAKLWCLHHNLLHHCPETVSKEINYALLIIL